MIEILFGLGITVITEIAKKFNISATYVVVGLCFFGGCVYTALNRYNKDLVDNLGKFFVASYATSQLIYMLYNKYKDLSTNQK